jgi:hypothetical protein
MFNDFRCPLWIPGIRYAIRTSKTICLYDHVSRNVNSLWLGGFSILHGTICINVIVHCYLGIYRHYKLSKKNKKNMSTLDSHKASANPDTTEYQILVTVFVLVAWTLIGKPF